jgi:hypothetical protein
VSLVLTKNKKELYEAVELETDITVWCVLL